MPTHPPLLMIKHRVSPILNRDSPYSAPFLQLSSAVLRVFSGLDKDRHCVIFELLFITSSPDGSVVRNLGNAGDAGSIPGPGRSPGAGNGNPLQCPCLESLMDRGAWWGYCPWGHERVGNELATKQQPQEDSCTCYLLFLILLPPLHPWKPPSVHSVSLCLPICVLCINWVMKYMAFHM